MARPRTFEINEALAAAMDVFWRRGYTATTMDDLTEATGLSRSSIYQTFESKRGLFDAVVERYLQTNISFLLDPLENGNGGVDDIVRFFDRLIEMLDAGVDGSLGCLMVNSIAELAVRDEAFLPLGDAYRDRLHAGFERALRDAAAAGEMDAAKVPDRADVLSATTMGVFLAGRGRPGDVMRNLALAAKREVSAWAS